MNMKIIPCAVADFYVRGDGAAVGAAGSHNDVALALTFNDTWKGLGKACVFWDARGENSVLCVLTEEMRVDGAYILPIPAEAKRYVGEIRMTVRGVEVGENNIATAIAMTATAYFKVLESDFDEDALPSVEVPTSIAEQLLAAASKALVWQNVSTTAEAGEEASVTVDVGEDGVMMHFTLPKGDPGEQGATGAQGPQGEKGEIGPTGPAGPAGPQGEKGADGKDGYTPIKGVDYFDGADGKDGVDGKDYVLTDDDKAEIVTSVLDALPAAEEAVF